MDMPNRVSQPTFQDRLARKNVVINADDIGIHPAVDEAVVQLAELRRLSAASVMTLGAPNVGTLTNLMRMKISLGLHLDFTSSVFNICHNTNYSLRSLIIDSWSRQLDRSNVNSLIADQLDRFEQLVGRPPVFVDGHQHVHQFPIIRESLIHILRSRYPDQRFHLRNTMPTIWRGWKAQLIGGLGARALRGLADDVGYKYNTDFCGAYDFNSGVEFYSRWDSWLTSLPLHGGLVMCHPGIKSAWLYDSIAETRVKEFDFLRGEQFSDLLSDLNVDVVRWDENPGPSDPRLSDIS